MRDPEELNALQERLGLTFRDADLLQHALRHRSACLDAPLESNERLEFVGDSIVGMIVCSLLFARFPQSSEGDLAKAKAYLASEPTLAEAGFALGLDRAVELSPSEEQSGGRARRSIMADTFEAVVAAIFLDQGIRSARRVVRQALKGAVRRVAEDAYQRDFKSMLQERTQAKQRQTPHYRIVSTEGLDHDRTFNAQALLGEKVVGEGAGKTKKEAEQEAARNALGRMGA